MGCTVRSISNSVSRDSKTRWTRVNSWHSICECKSASSLQANACHTRAEVIVLRLFNSGRVAFEEGLRVGSKL